MPYKAKITEKRRSLIVIMIDQSGSMNESFSAAVLSGEMNKTKAEMVAETSNIMLMDIIARCRSGATYKHYFDICCLGYSSGEVRTLLPNDLWFMSPSELAYSIKETKRLPRRVKTPSGSLLSVYSTLKVWIEPRADGDSPMCAAMQRLSELLYSWRGVQKHKDAFPPTIINITDGEVTDIIPEKLAKVREKISKLGTTDGEPILFNLHISGLGKKPVSFPRSDAGLNIEAKMLFDISSPLPAIYNSAIRAINHDTEESTIPPRAFSYNLPLSDFINAMQIGTATTQQIHL